MPERLVLAPEDVIAAATAAEAALRPVADRDWSVQAGPLEWDVERTIAHMIGATAKYTLYVLARQFPEAPVSGHAWPDLLAASGRPIRRP
jgi:hypothetical protein